jgi:hypothetical protein
MTEEKEFVWRLARHGDKAIFSAYFTNPHSGFACGISA